VASIVVKSISRGTSEHLACDEAPTEAGDCREAAGRESVQNSTHFGTSDRADLGKLHSEGAAALKMGHCAGEGQRTAER
jgi:hypothetical protein